MSPIRQTAGRERFYSGVFCLSLILLILVVPLLCLTRAAGGEFFLADRHKTAGIECSGCHEESPPKAAPTRACLQCHGSYDKLAIQTDKVDPNPHSSHLGERDCDACHHGHRASEDFCSQCHQFGFKVP